MAQGQAVTAAPLAASRSDDAPLKDLKTLEQYEKIIQLRDAVLSGQHPTIKLPPGVLASTWSPSGSREVSRPMSARHTSSDNQNSASDASASRKPPPMNPQDVPSQSSYKSRTADINPLFLQKSDELIKAEFRVQRRRLEQGIAEECAQHRSLTDNPEMYSDTELSLYLFKALALVQAAHPAPAVAPAVEGVAASANEEAASDSFDDDTFYSSKHPTPESTLTSRVRNGSEEVRQQNESSKPPRWDKPLASVPTNIEEPSLRQSQPEQSSTQTSPLHSFHVQPTSRSHETVAVAPTPFQVPGLNNYIDGTGQPGQVAWTTVAATPGQAVNPVPSGLDANGQSYKNAQEHLDDSYVEHHPPSPLVRTHDIAPAARQPDPTLSHTGPAAPVQLNVDIPKVAPAQVAALRNEPLSVDSPESSPQSGKEKKKGKKKKRKADRQAPEDVMPYIKPEPRSPSPMNAPTYIRPKKRQRQATRSGNNSDQDEVMVSAPQQPPPDARYYEPALYGYGSSLGYPQRAASAATMPAPRFEGAYGTEPLYAHRPPPTRYIERPPNPTYVRPPSHAGMDDGYREPPPIYRDRYETSRMSVRPDADPYVGQPMPPPPPQRIFIDSSGREYLEPSRPPARQSVAPPPSGREVVYEQPPPRAVSRYPAHAGHEDQRDVVYAGYPAPRRVVTQPEYVSRGYAEPPPREYSARPTGPPSEYVQIMPPAGDYGGDPARDYYSARTASVRPAEPLRHEYGRMQSAHPEPHRVEGHPDAYRVEYVPRPPKASAQYRGYSSRPPEQQHYEQPPVRQGGEVAYTERPGGNPQAMVYSNDGRREMYR